MISADSSRAEDGKVKREERKMKIEAEGRRRKREEDDRRSHAKGQ